MNKKVLGIIIALVILLGAVGTYFFYIKDNKGDAIKFSKEYSTVFEDNLFVYRTPKEIIQILQGGTGIIYFGFPECPWCQAYVPYLNEVAKSLGIEKIYYLNIKDIRQNNTSEYKTIVSLLKNYLLNDEEGESRIFVPDITVVKNGEIVAHDNETSYIDVDITPEEYWNEKSVKDLKTKLRSMILPIAQTTCTSCN